VPVEGAGIYLSLPGAQCLTGILKPIEVLVSLSQKVVSDRKVRIEVNCLPGLVHCLFVLTAVGINDAREKSV